MRRSTARPVLVPSAAMLLVAGLTVSCFAAPPATTPTTPTTELFHLPGIAGEMAIDRSLVSGLVDGGVASSATIVDWTGVDRGVPALTNVDRHHAQARLLADRITQASPASPIVLIAHSAGTGIAVEALEQLPPGVKIQTLVLLASALSPDYDLSAALGHVDGHAFSLFSSYDNLVLGAGTRSFGTYDRVWTDAAGYVGFRPPPAADAAAYAKLTQIPYDPAWTRLGHGGDHIGMTSRRFARVVLARLIRDGKLPATLPSTQPTAATRPAPLVTP